MNKWIPVTERLPENDDWNQIIVSLEFSEKYRESRCAYFTDGMFYGAYADFPYPDGIVKAWMPMPEPYERKEK